jgi:hypothetical protein
MKQLSFIFTLSLLFSIQYTNAQEIVGNLDVDDPNQSHIITTKTGDRLVGQITWINESELILNYKGNKLVFQRNELEKIEVKMEENEGNIAEPKSDIQVLDNLSDLPKEEATVSPSKPKYPFEIVGPLDLTNKAQRHKVFVNNGNIFVGRIRNLSDEKLTLLIRGRESLTFNYEEIMVVEVVGYEDPKEDLSNIEIEDVQPQKDTSRLYVLMTKRGDRFIGKVIEYGVDKVVFELENGALLTFPNDDVKQIDLKENADIPGYVKIKEDEEIEMNGAENLFLSPTGFNYREGLGEYKNLEVFYNSIDYGFSDNLSLGFGMVPLLVANIVDFKTKVTFDIGDYLHIGGGAHFLAGFIIGGFDDDNWALGVAHANASIGTREKFINFGYGRWMPISDDFVNIKSDLFMFGGSFRIAEKGRIFGDLIRVAERGESDFEQSDYSLVMLGGSWFNQKNRFDFGLFIVPESGSGSSQSVAFPMIGYARTIGKKK